MSSNLFHISCSGRSGSTFIYHALQRMGISVLHESNNTWPIDGKKGVKYFKENPTLFTHYRGIIGWKWALLVPEYANRFPVQFHLVRHPIKAIESATTHSDSLFTIVERYLGKPDFIPYNATPKVIKLGRAIHYWTQYNQIIGDKKPLLQIESFKPGGESLAIFCDKTNLSFEAGVLFDSLPTNINTRQTRFNLRRFKRRRDKLSLEDLYTHFPAQARLIRQMGDAYGYTL